LSRSAALHQARPSAAGSCPKPNRAADADPQGAVGDWAFRQLRNRRVVYWGPRAAMWLAIVGAEGRAPPIMVRAGGVCGSRRAAAAAASIRGLEGRPARAGPSGLGPSGNQPHAGPRSGWLVGGMPGKGVQGAGTRCMSWAGRGRDGRPRPDRPPARSHRAASRSKRRAGPGGARPPRRRARPWLAVSRWRSFEGPQRPRREARRFSRSRTSSPVVRDLPPDGPARKITAIAEKPATLGPGPPRAPSAAVIRGVHDTVAGPSTAHFRSPTRIVEKTRRPERPATTTPSGDRGRARPFRPASARVPSSFETPGCAGPPQDEGDAGLC